MRIKPALFLITMLFTTCDDAPGPVSTDAGTLPGLEPGGDTTGYWKAITRQVRELDAAAWVPQLLQKTEVPWRVIAVVDSKDPQAIQNILSLQKAAEAPGVEADVYLFLEAETAAAASALLLKSGTTLPGYYSTTPKKSWKQLLDPSGQAPEGPGLWIWAQGMTAASYYPWPEDGATLSGILYPATSFQ